MMYSDNSNIIHKNTRLLLIAALLAVLCVPAVQAQTQIGMDMIEQLLYNQAFDNVPKDEYHRVFSNFVRDRYRGRTWLYQSEVSDFTSSFYVYVTTSGVFDRTREKTNAGAAATKYNYRLTTDFRMYSNQDFDSAVVAALKKGAAVHFEEYGGYVDMDGETAKWARVTLPDGKTGWVFSGYLEKTPE